MNDQSFRIALPKLFLWNEMSRFQEYPEALSRAQADRTYTRVEIERELFDIAPTMEYKGGALRGRRTDGIINIYGLERSGARYRINGIDLLRKTEAGIIATAAGLELGRLYRDVPEGGAWSRALARQIMQREPRTRLLVGLILQGAKLELELAGSIPVGSITLNNSLGGRMTISNRDCHEFNELLASNIEMALGPYWRADLAELGFYGPVRFEGVQGDTPSTNDLPIALKKALALLFHVGVFDGEGNHWYSDPVRVSELFGAEVARSFGFSTMPLQEKVTEDEAFSRALKETTDGDGFVIISRLADKFGELLSVPGSERAIVLDNFIRGAMYHEHLRILERHPGQPRMGRGLFGESGSRRIRFDFQKYSSPTGSIISSSSLVGRDGNNRGKI